MEERSWRKNHGGEIREEKSWRRNHGGEIMKEKSWRINHGPLEEKYESGPEEGEIMEEESGSGGEIRKEEFMVQGPIWKWNHGPFMIGGHRTVRTPTTVTVKQSKTICQWHWGMYKL